MWLIQQGEFLELRYSGADGKRKQSSPTKRRKTYSADFCSIECILVPQQLTKRYQFPQTIKMMMIYRIVLISDWFIEYLCSVMTQPVCH